MVLGVCLGLSCPPASGENQNPQLTSSFSQPAVQLVSSHCVADRSPCSGPSSGSMEGIPSRRPRGSSGSSGSCGMPARPAHRAEVLLAPQGGRARMGAVVHVEIGSILGSGTGGGGRARCVHFKSPPFPAESFRIRLVLMLSNPLDCQR